MKDDASYLIDIIHYAGAAQTFVSAMTKEEFGESELVQLATRKALEIIGEASNKLTPEFKAANPSPEWAKMIGMRNISVHNYGNVDRDILWDVLKNKLPRLVALLTPLINLDDPGDQSPGL